jgi:hypothetical protein
MFTSRLSALFAPLTGGGLAPIHTAAHCAWRMLRLRPADCNAGCRMLAQEYDKSGYRW